MALLPPPPLPRFLEELRLLGRGSFEIERGPWRGREIHYIDEGDRNAPAVLMIHGNPTWSFLWRKVIAALPAFRCIAPDLLGFGLSSKLRSISDHSLERHIDVVTQFVDALEVERLILVGQDWGGPISMGVGARDPERVRGFVLGNTSVLVPKRPRGTPVHRFARLPIVSDIALRGLGLAHRTLSFVQGDRRSIRGRVQRAYSWPLRGWSNSAGPLALLRMVPDRTDHPSMPALRAGCAFATAFAGPKALVWGTRDPILGRALKRHADTFPDAPVTLTDAGHFLQEEVPDAIAAAIRDVSERAG